MTELTPEQVWCAALFFERKNSNEVYTIQYSTFHFPVGWNMPVTGCTKEVQDHLHRHL